MTRPGVFHSPFFVGFDEFEKLFERISRNSGDGYPPYNVEKLGRDNDGPERLRITLAVAGFAPSDLELTIEDNELVVQGQQGEETSREFLHRGIAARQFRRTFVLADGMKVEAARLANGLLTIELERPEPERIVKHIEIVSS